MSICFQLAWFSHLFYSWSSHTYILSLSFAMQDIVFSLLLPLGSLEKRGVGNNGMHLWDITYCEFSVRFFPIWLLPVACFPSAPFKKYFISSLLAMWGSLVFSSPGEGKKKKTSLCISKLKGKNVSSSHCLEAVRLKFCRSVGGSFKANQYQSWAKGNIYVYSG